MNKHTQQVVFSTGADEWATPDALFEELDAEFNFTIDAAADKDNHKCARWFGPGGELDDALVGSWGHDEVIWLNPPYSRPAQGQFIAKAVRAARRNIVVLLLPSRTDTKMFHEYIWNREHHRPHIGVELRFIKGRIKFKRSYGECVRTSRRGKGGTGGANDCAPFPSMLVVMGRDQ